MTNRAEGHARMCAQQHPQHRYAYLGDSLVARKVGDEAAWWPVLSATILGTWVDLGGQGLPLVNGEHVYVDSDWTEVVS